MEAPPSAPRPEVGARRRRPLNLTRIKSGIVFFVGAITAVGSALTGIGAQTAFAPMLTWMLGFTAEKAQATALRYAMLTAFAAAVGAYAAGATPEAYVSRALLLVIGAVIGAILAAPIGVRPGVAAQRKQFLSIGVALTLFVIVQTSHVTPWDIPYFAAWKAFWQLALLGFVVGGLTQVMGLASGILMVPALYYLAAFSHMQAVALTQLVVALASVLPAAAYTRRGLVDPVYGNWAALGGILGGLGGGLLLAHLYPNVILYLFALYGMFLCARELAGHA